MAEPALGLLNSTRLLFDLQQGNLVAQSLSGCLEPEEIARRVTDGLVEKFDCAFARIWLVEPDRTSLKLVASSGMYTNLNGSFARVPMGAFKVGKIAQNCIPFLSNRLAEETWVRDRDWAIAKGIQGFAGYPLVTSGDAVGVLAVFSQQPMASEFLEVLQGICTTVTIALENALLYQREKQSQRSISSSTPGNCAPLSEQLANLLNHTRLILVGTERPLTASVTCIFLRTAEVLSNQACIYCRLTYDIQTISLEAMVSSVAEYTQEQHEEVGSLFGDILFAASCLGGTLQIDPGAGRKAFQVLLTLPYPGCMIGSRLGIACRSPILQMAFTHLAYLAGFTVRPDFGSTIPLLTDDPTQAQTSHLVLWVATQTQAVPKQAKAKLDLSITPGQLREAVGTVMEGKFWGIEVSPEGKLQSLSDREQEIMSLLAQGLRDRDIAKHLIISESTVKFHINNVLAKLRAKTRYQAIHHVIVNGWIQ
ncbi:LuxR C-terminal-related transcriptional regulator [Kovacikia minuta CCNUW1]|uniref:LuxR C-terminal-related transcriptional regulator n=1 Tax=Kovacikia minuta TaxID=2931930 RepID=UPI001CCABC35|nr:LuxR C-terminal-related transcriptional regulator [Kovacikia minuta]UBF26435.1 LuxR C-terminal-related transcriptional regulator [Kovacikia minuta CCNUW1]